MSGQQRPSRFERGNDVVVMKFGGTSVENAAAVERMIAIAQSRTDARPAIVVSALAGVTDQLMEAAHAAAQGRLGAALAMARDIYVRHEQMAEELVSGAAGNHLEQELRGEYRALESFLQDLDYSRELDLRAQDRLLGFGERLSSPLVAVALLDAGVKAVHVDAQHCIVTDARHGQASPLWDVTHQKLQDALSPVLESGRVPVLGGFIASTVEGVPTTLGRGGSDFTVAIVAAVLGAVRVEIWTDVDGVMTTDPKLCAEARVIRKMSFEEATELAQWGAKVLHPATLAPAMRENIPVYVRNSRRPEVEGTEIGVRARSAGAVSGITAKRNVAAIEIESARGLNSAVLRDVYAAFDRRACPVEVMAASLGRLWLLVASTAELPGIAADLRHLASVRWENHQSLVCLVGENIRRQPEVASRAFASVADMDVRVVCQGASDRTISFLVDESRVEESVRRLHRTFFPAPREAARDWGGASAAYCQAG